MVAVRQLVVERFADNPAYQLLKARFLSCFTVPALLATVQPITDKTVTCPENEDEEEDKDAEEEELEIKKIKERGRQRRAEVSSAADGGPVCYLVLTFHTATYGTEQQDVFLLTLSFIIISSFYIGLLWEVLLTSKDEKAVKHILIF